MDSTGGSDRNGGTSANSAFASLNKIANLNLKPGDQVLLERGNTFTDTLRLKGFGSEKAPITIGAYGVGADPVLSGASGLVGTNVSHVVVKGPDFPPIPAGLRSMLLTSPIGRSTDVVLKNTGKTTGTGSISFYAASDLTISNSEFNGVHNDGIYATDVSDVTIKNNSFSKLTGTRADGIQLTGADNVLIQGNHIDMASSPDSTKGGVIIEDGTNILVLDNEVEGGRSASGFLAGMS